LIHVILPYPKQWKNHDKWEYCSNCRGLGELTWLENIFGKELLSMSEIHLRQNKRDEYFKR